LRHVAGRGEQHVDPLGCGRQMVGGAGKVRGHRARAGIVHAAYYAHFQQLQRFGGTGCSTITQVHRQVLLGSRRTRDLAGHRTPPPKAGRADRSTVVVSVKEQQAGVDQPQPHGLDSARGQRRSTPYGVYGLQYYDKNNRNILPRNVIRVPISCLMT